MIYRTCKRAKASPNVYFTSYYGSHKSQRQILIIAIYIQGRAAETPISTVIVGRDTDGRTIAVDKNGFHPASQTVRKVNVGFYLNLVELLFRYTVLYIICKLHLYFHLILFI